MRWLLISATACAVPILLLGQQLPGPPVPPAGVPTGRDDGTVAFEDVTRSAGIRFVHDGGVSPDKRILETLGSGVAWLDYDNDGWQDLYFVNGATGAANVLYRNTGKGTFADVTSRAGVGRRDARQTGVAVGDYDNDGDLDLFVTAFGPNVLYRNNANGTFTDVTATAGVAGESGQWSTSAGFLDYDRDGDVDLYVGHYLDYRMDDNPYCGLEKPGHRMYCSPSLFDGQANRLFRNDGNGRFSDVSRQAGVANPAGKTLGLAVCDVDRDGLVDVYVANDGVRNFLYRNNGDGTFRDIAYSAGVGFDANGRPQAGMGTDCEDVNANGLPDIFVTNLSDELNTLYSNLGKGLFEDATIRAGLGSGFAPLGFGTKFFDADNDGDLDLLVANGHVLDNVALYHPTYRFAQAPLFYENDGAGAFRDVSRERGAALRVETVGRGLAVADFDNDGRLDVAISNLGQAPVLLRNVRTPAGHWMLIRAKGRTSNAFGVGARIRIETANGVQTRDVNNVASYLSANDLRLHFGLGSASRIQRIDVRWPSGVQQTLTDVAADQILTIDEP